MMYMLELKGHCYGRVCNVGADPGGVVQELLRGCCAGWTVEIYNTSRHWLHASTGTVGGVAVYLLKTHGFPEDSSRGISLVLHHLSFPVLAPFPWHDKHSPYVKNVRCVRCSPPRTTHPSPRRTHITNRPSSNHSLDLFLTMSAPKPQPSPPPLL